MKSYNKIFSFYIKQEKSLVEITFRGIILLFFGTLSILAISAPVIQSIYGFPNGENIYRFLSPICHQYPTRSLWILDRPFALCARCFSGYFGLTLGALLIASESKYIIRGGIGLLMILPGVFDGLMQLQSSYESSNFIRFITGILGGIGIFMIINPFKYKKRRNE
jgi:uncharacterized membrane protein